jgi:hypothetical protein
MKNLWQIFAGNAARNELYFILDDEKYETFSNQNVQDYLTQLASEQISPFALSSVEPVYFNAKERDLALTRSLLANTKVKFPFHLKIRMHQIVEPKSYRPLLTFVRDGKINQYECWGATKNEVFDLWNHLAVNQECDTFNWDEKWSDISEWYAGYLSAREEQERKELAYPPLLRDIWWNFSEGTFKIKEEFANVVNDYHKELGKKWNPDEKVLVNEELIVYYPYYVDDSERTGTMTLKNTESWTALDLLFAIHNKCVKKISGQDAHFFEGLSYYQDNAKGVPIYFLNLGN